MLCKTCKTKLRLGKISNYDIEVSKVLLELEKTHARLQKTKFVKAFKIDEYVILVGNSKFKSALNNDEIKQDLIQKLQAKIIVLTKQKSDKQTLDEIFNPMVLDGIDKIFVPDGTYELKVRLKGDQSKLPLSLSDMQKIASKAIDADIRLELVTETEEWKISDKKIEPEKDENLENPKNLEAKLDSKADKQKNEHEEKLLQEITGKNSGNNHENN